MQSRVRRWRSCASLLAICVASLTAAVPTHRPTDAVAKLDARAQEFVRLALSLGKLRTSEVDAYFGPARLREAADSAQSLDGLLKQVRALRSAVEAPTGSAGASERSSKLSAQVRALDALITVIDTRQPRKFDDEAFAIYGMRAHSATSTLSTSPAMDLQALDALLPGQGTLVSRVEAFRSQFIVPRDRRQAVFERALFECRARTLERWTLPANERLEVKWTSDVPAAWHRYDGHAHSTLQVNPDAVGFLGSAIDIACHEGYPGHHTQFVIMEADAGADGLSIENTVVLLRSPISMLREGAANYGIDLVFTPAQRLAFERDVLFPLAGFDPARAARYAEVHRLVGELARNVVPIVRDYRDGRLSAAAAGRALESSALVSSPDALLRFVDRLGPYVLGYTAARDYVRDYIESENTTTGTDRWTALRHMLARADVTALRNERDPP
jgi:hypothetical protein